MPGVFYIYRYPSNALSFTCIPALSPPTFRRVSDERAAARSYRDRKRRKHNDGSGCVQHPTDWVRVNNLEEWRDLDIGTAKFCLVLDCAVSQSASQPASQQASQECRSAGVQEGRSAGVQGCRSAGVRECRRQKNLATILVTILVGYHSGWDLAVAAGQLRVHSPP